MDVSHDQIHSFLKVAELKQISSAANALGISQPALSIKLKKLETDLGLTLLIRTKQGTTLTKEGLQFVQYAKTRLALERELISQVIDSEDDSAKKEKLEDTIRIAGHYSILHHGIVPSLQGLLENNPKLQIQLIVKEDARVSDMLVSGAADLALLQAPLRSPQFEHVFLGEELYVAVEAKAGTKRAHVFLDSDPVDTMTEKFFSIQNRGKPKDYMRSFLHDENGIGRGVALGLGRAIIAKNEVKYHPGIRIVQGYTPYRLPAYLHWAKQTYSSRAHRAAREEILKNISECLSD